MYLGSECIGGGLTLNAYPALQIIRRSNPRYPSSPLLPFCILVSPYLNGLLGNLEAMQHPGDLRTYGYVDLEWENRK